jgi:hypothetical protein
VIDLRRPQLANGGAHAIPVEEIDGLPRPGHDAVRRRPAFAPSVLRRGKQVLDEMAAGKAAGAGHQNDVAHCRC